MCYVVIFNPLSYLVVYDISYYVCNQLGCHMFLDHGSSHIILVIMIEIYFQHSEILILYLRCVDCMV